MITSAQLFVFDDSAISPIMPSIPLELSDNVADYCLSLFRKIRASEHKKVTILSEDCDVASALDDVADAYSHEHITALMLGLIARARRFEMDMQGFDMLAFLLEDAGNQYITLCHLPYSTAQVHTVAGTQGALALGLVKNRYILPTASSKKLSGVIVDCSNMELTIKDTLVDTSGEKMLLFEELFFECEKALSQVEAIETIKEIASEVAGEFLAPQKKEAVHRAIADSIEQSGTVDIAFVADEVYKSDPVRQEEFHEKLDKIGVQDVIPIESNRLKNAFERVKLSTDNGITITMSRKIAEDQQSFSVQNNPDGSISIQIKNIQSVRTL